MRNDIDKVCGMILNRDMETATNTTTAPALADLVKVGDFFTCSWGYDQTNVNFYEVVAVTKASVKLVPVASAMLSDDGCGSTKVAPLAGTPRRYDSFLPIDRPSVKRARIHEDTRWNGAEAERFWSVSVRFESYAFGHLWDCAPMRETSSGWGH